MKGEAQKAPENSGTQILLTSEKPPEGRKQEIQMQHRGYRDHLGEKLYLVQSEDRWGRKQHLDLEAVFKREKVCIWTAWQWRQGKVSTETQTERTGAKP